MGISVYQLVTDRIIAELEKGNIPWNKPWTGIRSGASNKWRNVSAAPATKMIQIAPELSIAETQALAARQTTDANEEIKAIGHIYIEKNGRYVLHRDVELMNGNHVLLDCQSNTVTA